MIRLVFCFLTIVLPLTSTYAQNYWEIDRYRDDVSGEPMLEVEAPIWIFRENINGVHNGVFVLRWDRLSYPECEEMTGVYINTKGKSFDVSLRCVKTIANPDHC